MCEYKCPPIIYIYIYIYIYMYAYVCEYVYKCMNTYAHPFARVASRCKESKLRICMQHLCPLCAALFWFLKHRRGGIVFSAIIQKVVEPPCISSLCLRTRVVSHIRTSHVKYMNKSCHARIILITTIIRQVVEPSCISGLGLRKSHVTHINESWYTHE